MVSSRLSRVWLYIETAQLDQIRLLSRQSGASQSEVLRRLLRSGLASARS